MKRITVVLIAVLMILVFSLPVFATPVTIPVSGVWQFHDTLDFSSLSSDLTETVNFLSDGVPYTGMTIASGGSLHYTNSSSDLDVYGSAQAVTLYTPAAGYTQYAIIEYVYIDSGRRSSSYFIRWFATSTTSVTSRIVNNGSSSSSYALVSSSGYKSISYDTIDEAVAAIQSSSTAYTFVSDVPIGYVYVTSNGTYTVNNAVPYSSVTISVPNQVKTANYTVSGRWSIVSSTSRPVQKIDSNEVVKVIGSTDGDTVGGTAQFRNEAYKTIQFGRSAQEVSAEFYSFLVRNATPISDSIVDSNGDGYDDASYDAGNQAGYAIGYADGQISSDSYDLGYSVGYDTGLTDGQLSNDEQVYNNGFDAGYKSGYNVGKDYSKNQSSSADEVGNFFVRMLSAITSFLLYLGINISFRGVTILTVLFFIIIGLLVFLIVRKLIGGKD